MTWRWRVAREPGGFLIHRLSGHARGHGVIGQFLGQNRARSQNTSSAQTRALDQSGFGPNPTVIADLRGFGFKSWRRIGRFGSLVLWLLS